MDQTIHHTIHRAIHNALSGKEDSLTMAHITANDLKTRGIAAIEAMLAESQADIAAGRFVVESPARHVARLQAIIASEGASGSAPADAPATKKAAPGRQGSAASKAPKRPTR